MQIMLCAISNISSGGCDEDCKFCTQSNHVQTKIEKYPSKSVETVLAEARQARANHALGFCLVTSGAGLDDSKLEYVCKLARAINKEDLGLMLIGCNGIASKEQLSELKKAGIFSYNHNLETSKRIYPKICSSHSWEERYVTNLNAKEAGLELCCGGIYGLGESQQDRQSFRKSLKELKPFSSPINFFIGNEDLKLKIPPLGVDEALQIIKDSHQDLPNTHLMVAGGREHVLGSRQYEIFENGASAIVIGDYLTVKGEQSSKEIKELQRLGFSFFGFLPLTMHASLGDGLYLLLTLAFILLFSPSIARLSKLPLGACEILLGSIAAALGALPSNPYFTLLANIGFYYLMFIAGMEVNLKKFFKSKARLIKLGLIYIVFLYAASFLAVQTIKLPWVFIVIIPVMSVGLLGVLYKDFGKDCKWLNASMVVATLAELASIVGLTITAALSEKEGLGTLFLSILYLLGFLLLALFSFKFLRTLFWWYPQLKTLILPKGDKNEKDIRFCMSIFILIIALMSSLSLEIALGAFIAGAFLATFFDHHEDLEHKLGSFGYGFLIPVFFIHVGSSFDLSLLLDLKILLAALGLSLFMIMLRLAGSFLFIKSLGFKGVLLFGLSHSMPLTLLIAVATLSLEVGLVDIRVYSCLVLAAVLETILAFSFIKAFARK